MHQLHPPIIIQEFFPYVYLPDSQQAQVGLSIDWNHFCCHVGVLPGVVQHPPSPISLSRINTKQQNCISTITGTPILITHHSLVCLNVK